jgi:hypothetical protein
LLTVKNIIDLKLGLWHGMGMYGKSFESLYEGSMVGAGINVFAVWSYIITKCRRGVIEINPKLLAFTLGGTEQEIVDALNFLQKPDPNSRSKKEDGKRIVKDGQFQYTVVNWDHYDKIRSEDDRREYNRVKKQEQREKESCEVGMITGENVCSKRFVKPTIDEVKLQCAKVGLPEPEADKFWNFYESKGWKVGRSPMKSWTAAMTGWLKRWSEYNRPYPSSVNKSNADIMSDVL